MTTKKIHRIQYNNMDKILLILLLLPKGWKKVTACIIFYALFRWFFHKTIKFYICIYVRQSGVTNKNYFKAKEIKVKKTLINNIYLPQTKSTKHRYIIYFILWKYWHCTCHLNYYFIPKKYSISEYNTLSLEHKFLFSFYNVIHPLSGVTRQLSPEQCEGSVVSVRELLNWRDNNIQ